MEKLKKFSAITILLLLFLGNYAGFGQTEQPLITQYKIKYKVKFSPDTTDLESKKEETLYLYAGADFSVFMNYDLVAQEKQIAEIKKKYGGNISMNMTFGHYSEDPNFEKTFYKDHTTKEVITIGKISDQEYQFTEPEIPLQWDMQDSTKTIGEYVVQKATTHFSGRDYVAWFTPELPIPDGPYVFGGLPGLIIQLYDTDKEYFFEMNSLKKVDTPRHWEIPQKEKTITKAGFQEKLQKFRHTLLNTNDLGTMISNAGIPINSTITTTNGKITSAELEMNGQKISKEQFKRLYKKNQRKHNNSIER